jgi:hypothetical protein
MSWPELLNDFVLAEARVKAATDHARPIRAKVTEEARNKWNIEGADRWVRHGLGIVSLCKPSPFTQITDRAGLVKWLVGNGHGDLVHPKVTVKDSQKLSAALKLLKSAGAGLLLTLDLVEEELNGPDGEEDGRELLNDAVFDVVDALDVTDDPVADVWEQLAAADGFAAVPGPPDDERDVCELVTADGEIVPGLVRVTPEPDRVRVLVDKGLRSRVAVDLLVEDADEEAAAQAQADAAHQEWVTQEETEAAYWSGFEAGKAAASGVRDA